ncbi:hypothetical protein SAMN05444007_103452 [Cribrihabitans marinus]|jgi:hypothetical protein|uniref:Uncharacterized protein n=1 Tax=Cribrihabitans marinus TaxID=1227549 RepID=A0A1H6WL33_9RHOB|nr:hypothetical protein [Cribrihabitans marinus]GGH24054.1 hypothetical protein GCM10010973_10340 [Cribrihabitans marinus]SEJ15904.1 hypothetical protein SAMN05444007_103452 [Cribrihabitans marinus]
MSHPTPRHARLFELLRQETAAEHAKSTRTAAMSRLGRGDAMVIKSRALESLRAAQAGSRPGA